MIEPTAVFTNNDSLPDPDLTDIKLRGAYVLLRPLEVESKTAGGLYIPEEAQDSYRQVMCMARVLAVGPTHHDNDIMGDVGFNVGDIVMFDKIAAERRLLLNNVQIVLIHGDKILAVGNGLRNLKFNNLTTKG